MVLMNYLQGRDRNTDIENEHVDVGWCGHGRVDQIGRIESTYIHFHV